MTESLHNFHFPNESIEYRTARNELLEAEIALRRNIETVAELLASRILADFATPQVRVLVRKLSPVLEPHVNHVSIEIVRSR